MEHNPINYLQGGINYQDVGSAFFYHQGYFCQRLETRGEFNMLPQKPPLINNPGLALFQRAHVLLGISKPRKLDYATLRVPSGLFRFDWKKKTSILSTRKVKHFQSDH